MLYCGRCKNETPVTDAKLYDVEITGKSPYRNETVMEMQVAVCRPCREAGWAPKPRENSLRWKNDVLGARCVHENKIELMNQISDGIDPFAKTAVTPAPKKKTALKK